MSTSEASAITSNRIPSTDPDRLHKEDLIISYFVPAAGERYYFKMPAENSTQQSIAAAIQADYKKKKIDLPSKVRL